MSQHDILRSTDSAVVFADLLSNLQKSLQKKNKKNIQGLLTGFDLFIYLTCTFSVTEGDIKDVKVYS